MATVSEVKSVAKRQGRIFTIEAEASVREAAAIMGEHHVGSLIVTDSAGRAVGIVTERDVLNEVVAAGRDPESVRVGRCMTAPVVACRPQTSVENARRVMARHGIRHLPIVDRSLPVGMVSSRDILAHELCRAKAALRRQSDVLSGLERRFPGITDLQRDATGRILI